MFRGDRVLVEPMLLADKNLPRSLEKSFRPAYTCFQWVFIPQSPAPC